MIGIIQRTLSDCLVEAGGDALRRDVYREAGVPEDRVFRMDQNYPDEETGRLIDATLRLTGLDTGALYALFSKRFIRFIREVFPEFMKMSENSEDLVRMQAKIHALLAAGMRSKEEREATTDKFSLVDHGPHRLTVRYRSQLQLCGLYKQLVRDMAAEFGDRVEIDTMECRKSGAEACRFCVRWIAIGGRDTDPDLHRPLGPRLVALN